MRKSTQAKMLFSLHPVGASGASPQEYDFSSAPHKLRHAMLAYPFSLAMAYKLQNFGI